MNDYFKDVEPRASGDGPQPAAGQRSIRNISISSRARTPRRASEMAPPPPGRAPRRKGGTRWGMWVIAVLLVAALGVLGFFFFSGTTVTVTPRTHTVVFDEQATFTALPANFESSEGEGNTLVNTLMYSISEREFEASVVVEADGVERVEDRASGKLTIINNHSEDNLRLIKNTRFETPTGLVYRIRNSVVVPGKSGSTPGELEVTVFADEPGERYNIGAVNRFTLPGLRTTAPEMFDNVFARSSASMTGGFVGERPVVDESALENARTSLQTQLEDEARTTLAAEASGTESRILGDLFEITFEEPAPGFNADGSVVVREVASVRVPQIESGDFARAIAVATSADAGDGTVRIEDPATVGVRTLHTDTPELGVDAIDFSLSGNAQLVWEVETARLASDLAGKSKEAFQSILEGHPGVDEANADIRPFWKNSFPEDPEKIAIILSNDAASE